MYWHTQHPAANAICLLLYTDRPSLHRRSNHPRWVLTGGLDHSGRDFSLNPDSPLDGAKTTNIGAEIPCRFSVTFSEGTHKPESHKHTKVHDVRANSCSLTYGLGWGQQLEARCLLRMSRAVSLGLYFSDTQYRVSQPTAPILYGPRRPYIANIKSTHQQDAVKPYVFMFIQCS